HPNIHSFPTRRSSDLAEKKLAAGRVLRAKDVRLKVIRRTGRTELQSGPFPFLRPSRGWEPPGQGIWSDASRFLCRVFRAARDRRPPEFLRLRDVPVCLPKSQ